MNRRDHGPGRCLWRTREFAQAPRGHPQAAPLVCGRVGQVADRAHQGSGRGGVAHRGDPRPLPQGATADGQGDQTGRHPDRPGRLIVRQHVTPAVAAAGRTPPPGGRLGVRLWRQQLSRGPRRAPPGQARPGLGRVGRTLGRVRRHAPIARRRTGPRPDRHLARLRPARRGISNTVRPGCPLPVANRRPQDADRPGERCGRGPGQDRRRPDRDRVAGGRRRVLRPRADPGRAGRAVPRPGLASRRHAPGRGHAVPGNAGHPGRRQPDGRRAGQRCTGQPPTLGPHLPATRVHLGRFRSSGSHTQGDRHRPAGPRRGEHRPVPRAPGTVRDHPGRLRRAQLRRTPGPGRGRPADGRGDVPPVLAPRPADGRAAGR